MVRLIFSCQQAVIPYLQVLMVYHTLHLCAVLAVRLMLPLCLKKNQEQEHIYAVSYYALHLPYAVSLSLLVTAKIKNIVVQNVKHLLVYMNTRSAEDNKDLKYFLLKVSRCLVVTGIISFCYCYDFSICKRKYCFNHLICLSNFK